MSRKRRGSYDVEYMRIVVGLIRDGIGAKSLARRLGVSKETTREWLLSYRIGGEAALMGEREGNRKYDYETKLAAVLDHLERGMSRPEVMERYGIASRTCLKQWCQDYRRGGPEACVCSIESGPCERVDVFHVSGRFWSPSACGEKRTPARPAWTSFPS